MKRNWVGFVAALALALLASVVSTTALGADGEPSLQEVPAPDVFSQKDSCTSVPSSSPASGNGITIQGTAGDDILIGTSGDDVIFGLGGNDIIIGHGGSDELRGGSGADILVGGAGDDQLWGFSGADTLCGNSGNDTLHGENGADNLNGQQGDDVLFGGAHNDTAFGGVGDDTLWGSTGFDLLVGDSGNDQLNGGDSADQLLGGDGDDVLRSDGGEDSLWGGSGVDRLFGGDQRDALYGGRDDDILNGENGADTLVGGSGSDIGRGGAGADACRVEQATSCESNTGSPGTASHTPTPLDPGGLDAAVVDLSTEQACVGLRDVPIFTQGDRYHEELFLFDGGALGDPLGSNTVYLGYVWIPDGWDVVSSGSLEVTRTRWNINALHQFQLYGSLIFPNGTTEFPAPGNRRWILDWDEPLENLGPFTWDDRGALASGSQRFISVSGAGGDYHLITIEADLASTDIVLEWSHDGLVRSTNPEFAGAEYDVPAPEPCRFLADPLSHLEALPDIGIVNGLIGVRDAGGTIYNFVPVEEVTSCLQTVSRRSIEGAIDCHGLVSSPGTARGAVVDFTVAIAGELGADDDEQDFLQEILNIELEG